MEGFVLIAFGPGPGRRDGWIAAILNRGFCARQVNDNILEGEKR